MKKYASWIGLIVVVIIIVGSMVWYTSGPGEYDTFATCVNKSGATFWGAWWCPHCKEQKALFGKSEALLPYHECSSPDGSNELADCKTAGVASYPTWDFKNLTNPATTTRMNGTLSLVDIAKFTGCPLIKDSK